MTNFMTIPTLDSCPVRINMSEWVMVAYAYMNETPGVGLAVYRKNNTSTHIVTLSNKGKQSGSVVDDVKYISETIDRLSQTALGYVNQALRLKLLSNLPAVDI